LFEDLLELIWDWNWIQFNTLKSPFFGLCIKCDSEILLPLLLLSFANWKKIMVQ